MANGSGENVIAGPGRFTRIGLNNCSPPTLVARRRDLYRALRSALVAIDDVEVLTPPLYPGVCPFGVVIRVQGGESTRDRMFERLRYHGNPVQRLQWKCSFVDDASFPGARTLRDEVLVIPTLQHVSQSLVSDVAQVVERHSETA